MPGFCLLQRENNKGKSSIDHEQAPETLIGYAVPVHNVVGLAVAGEMDEKRSKGRTVETEAKVRAFSAVAWSGENGESEILMPA